MPAASAPQEEPLAVSRYEMIRDTLRASITQGRAAPGLVLVEAPLAQLFGTSRVPVRQALNLLHDEGLICRFRGRGRLWIQTRKLGAFASWVRPFRPHKS